MRRPSRTHAPARWPAALGPCALALLLSACAAKAPAPDWAVDARSASERYRQAHLTGASRAAQSEFLRARSALAATGQAGQVARIELTRCALQVASLDFSECAGFEPLREDAPAAERAYAAYLGGAVLAADLAALLPAAHRAVAAGASDPATWSRIDDPLSRLVAAGVLVRRGQGAPALLEAAVSTASQQGWRRPLLAWMGAQLQWAEGVGDAALAERLRRGMALAAGD